MFRPTTASVADAVDFSGPERFVSKLFKSLLRIYRWLISYRGGSPSHVEKIPSPGKNCIWSNFSSCIPYVELDDRLAVKTLENWCLGLRRHTESSSVNFDFYWFQFADTLFYLPNTIPSTSAAEVRFGSRSVETDRHMFCVSS